MIFDTRISLHKLDVLCAVVDTGGIGRAADKLYLSQPVVSAHIRSLEDRLGVELFDRSGRGVELTEGGKTVYRWASECLALGREMIRDLEGFSSGSAGVVTVAAGTSVEAYIMPRLLSAFLGSSPGPSVTLNRRGFREALSAVADDIADCALVLGELDAPRPNLETEHLRDEELVLVAAPQSEIPSRIDGEELQGLTFACSPTETSYRRRTIDRLLAEQGMERREISLMLEHPSAIKQCVRQDIGVAFLFRASVADDLAAGALREVEIDGLRLAAPLLLVTRSGKRHSTAQKDFLDYCRTALASPAVPAVPALGEPVTA